ncbi:unnamed protein product [Plutella xylostella]|uniref:(diamondback moth) hypothetical protein n=1 Tax=Plutella xylostella TaxID=51655 RepID=A0A8S4EGT5_PLUXY|nr:unnamed protein product [Plutella xylostella]
MSKLTLALLVLCACVAVSMAAPQVDLESVVGELTPLKIGEIMTTLLSAGKSSGGTSAGGAEGEPAAASS